MIFLKRFGSESLSLGAITSYDCRSDDQMQCASVMVNAPLKEALPRCGQASVLTSDGKRSSVRFWSGWLDSSSDGTGEFLGWSR